MCKGPPLRGALTFRPHPRTPLPPSRPCPRPARLPNPPSATPVAVTTPAPAVATPSLVAERVWPAPGVSAVSRAQPDGSVVATFTVAPDTPLTPGAVLHWALAGWTTPPDAVWPPGTVGAGGGAVRTQLPAAGGELTITFPGPSVPPSLVFVLNDGDAWLHDGGGDFSLPLAPPSAAGVLARALAVERGGSASLFERFAAVAGVADDAAAAGVEGVGVLAAWLRLSNLRLLPWYGGGACHQPKDVAGVQKAAAQKVARLAAVGAGDDAAARVLARVALACVPRGGGAGDDVRHGILNIMREHGIREGHR